MSCWLFIQKAATFYYWYWGDRDLLKVIREKVLKLGSRVNGTNERIEGNKEKWEKEVKPYTQTDYLLIMSDSEHVSTL